MTSCLKQTLGCITLLLIFHGVRAQKDSSTQHLADVLTADSLASGNTKDVLTSFFQLAFNKLTGPNKELDFTSNPYAILLRTDTSLAVDTNYYKYHVLRKLNFGFGLKLDSSSRFNGFSSGITYALINKRDSSTSKKLFYKMRHDPFYAEIEAFHDKLNDYLATIEDHASKKKFNQLINTFLSGDTAFNKLDSSFQKVAISIARADTSSFKHILNFVTKKPSYNLAKMKKSEQDSLTSLITNDWLWTVGVSDTTYTGQFFFKNVSLNTELIKGLYSDSVKKAGSNIELDIKSAVNFLDDTLVQNHNLKRAIFNIQPGLNWVIRGHNDRQSWLELQFSGYYSHNLTNLYAGEKRDSLTFNGTVRIRISKIWIPIEIKYDPRSGNVFGFVDIRFNFSTLGNAANSSKSAAKKSD
jgi:hypothetical protein